ncbi:MAG: sulfurtransferase [Deltaproteobacteria bacterium]|nr:sulfurtransferase [Deltaproteobacteria bacterium]
MIHQTILKPGLLADHLKDPDWVVFDCRFELGDSDAGRRAWTKGHIPGARYAHLEHHLSGPKGNQTGRHPLPVLLDFIQWLESQGVDNHTQVVAYDDQGGAFAARLWWLLRFMGHKAAAVLDGGYTHWLAEGLPVSTFSPKPEAKRFSPSLQSFMLVTDRQAEACLGDPAILFVDARAPERFRGEVEPIDPVAGHIPGAVNLPHPQNLDAEGRFLYPHLLKARFEQKLNGLSPEQVIHYCGSGVTAATNAVAMAAGGLPLGRLYVGSWSQWCSKPGRATAQGPE